MTEDLANIRTLKLESKKDLCEASRLTSNYCFHPIPYSILQLITEKSRWSYGELLTDMVVNPKDHTEARDTVGFVLFTDSVRHKGATKGTPYRELPKILYVKVFAVEPWYDINVAVTWVTYRIKKLLEARKDFVKVVWSVDEYDTPLQEALKTKGYRAIETLTLPVSYFYTSGPEDIEVSRIVFEPTF